MAIDHVGMRGNGNVKSHSRSSLARTIRCTVNRGHNALFIKCKDVPVVLL